MPAVSVDREPRRPSDPATFDALLPLDQARHTLHRQLGPLVELGTPNNPGVICPKMIHYV